MSRPPDEQRRDFAVKQKYLIPLFGTFVLWGSLYVVSKIALRTIPAVTLLALRYLVSIPALYAILRIRRVLRPVARGDRGTIFAIGFVGYFASFCLQMLGISRLTGSAASLLGAMNPVFIPILAAVFLHERLTVAKVACVAASMTGVFIIGGVGGQADALGAVLMLGSVFLWSSASIIIRRVGGRYDPMQVAMLAMICALPFVMLWSALELRTQPITVTAEGVLAVLYMGLLGTAAPHSLWNFCLSKMDASFCSMFYPLQPLVSSALGVLVLGEQMTPNFVIGGLIICCGVVMAVLSGRKRAA